MTTENLTIQMLETENFKRINSITVNPSDGLICIGGNNAQGKTSLIDSIMVALGGKKLMPSKPIREGCEKSTIKLTLANGGEVEYTIETTMKMGDDGKVKHTVRLLDKEGHAVPKSQTFLDQLFSSLTFDPSAFLHMDAKKQKAALMKVLSLDFTDLESKRDSIFQTRTDVGRDKKRHEGALAEAPFHADTPDEEVSISEAIAALDDAKALRDMKDAHSRLIDQNKKRIAELRAEIEKCESYIKRHEGELDALPETPDLEALQAKVTNAEEINARVRANQEHSRLKASFKASEKHWDELSKEIKAIDEDKERQLAEAKCPVRGLAFDESGVTFQGQPFDQASAAEQLRVSFAMATAMSPSLKVCLIRDGSKFDEHALVQIAEMSEANEMQVWVERVGKGSECAVIIEDGCELKIEGSEAAPDAGMPAPESAESKEAVAAA